MLKFDYYKFPGFRIWTVLRVDNIQNEIVVPDMSAIRQRQSDLDNYDGGGGGHVTR